MQKRETEIGEIPRRHRGHRQCACNFELTPQDIQPGRENFRPRLVTPNRRALSLIIDRNVRCTAGNGPVNSSIRSRTCRDARTVNSRTHSLLHLSRSLGPPLVFVFGSLGLRLSVRRRFLLSYAHDRSPSAYI